MPSRFKHILLLSFLFCNSFCAFAQFENIRFERIGAESGIPYCNIEQVIEDHFGFLWFATCEGLFQYDGYKFKAYRHDVTDSTSISDPFVYSVFEDKGGNIWACTANGLNLLDRRTGKFQTFRPNPEDNETKISNHVRLIFEDSRGNLWVDSNRNLLKFDRDSKQFTRLQDEADQERNHLVREIIEDKQGVIWAGTNYGLLKVNRDGVTFQSILPYSNPESNFNRVIKQIIEEKDGSFLMATLGGLLHWNPVKNEVLNNFLPADFKQYPVDHLMIDRKGNYWFSFYKKGIAVYDRKLQKFHFYKHNPDQLNSLIDDEVSWMLEDRFRNIWVCTKSGICKIKMDNSGFNLFQNHVGFDHISNQVIRVLKDKNGATWSVTPDGIFVIENGQQEGKKVEIINDADYFAGAYLFEDTDGGIWLTINEKGIYYKASGHPNFQQLALGDTIATATVYKIIKDINDDDLLWLGTSYGLCKLNRKTFKRKWYIPTQDIPEAPSNKVSIFEQFGSDEIWMYYTYYNSLGRFDKNSGKFELFRPPPDKKEVLEGAVKDIVISDDGNIWLATLYGLTNFKIKTKEFAIYTQKDGLDENMLNTIVLDKNGRIWVCGNRFLSLFDPANRTFKNYYIANEVKNFWSKSKYLTDDGSILLGSLNGIYTFNPDEVTENQELPNLVLTDFKVKDKTYLLEKAFENTTDIILSHDENDITFEFSAIHYINPPANKYRCKLEGFNDDWRDLGNEHKASYTNLNPGSYVFRVMASNSHGVWNEKGLSIHLIIAPAFWQTMWFKGLILLVLLTIVYAIVKNRQHKILLKRQKALAEQSAEYKTRFLADVSHEIRTPMNAIIGLSNLILGTDLDKKQHKFVNAIQQSSKNLLTIINDLLDHTKLEAGKFTFAKKPFDLYEIIEQLKDTFSHKAEEKQLGFELGIDPEIPENLIGDPLRLTQILTNLLGNALKFTDQGKVWLKAELKQSANQKSQVSFEVGDTGIGIAEDQIDLIFESFNQAENEKHNSTEGTGLGLSIARQLVEKQGGQLFIESELGKGTRLWFDLVFENAAPVEKVQLQENGEFSLENLNILVVEDTYFNQMLVVEILKKHIKNVTIEVAENGKIALEKVKLQPFDILLMDVKMPVMDGYETTKHIRNLEDASLKNIPILAVTANAVPEQLQKCKASGMNDFVTKPIDETELLQKIFSLTQNHQLIDKTKLKALLGNDENRVQRFLGIFKSQTPEQLRQLKIAIAEQNWEQVAILAHGIKSQCRYLSLENGADLAFKIEQLAETEKQLDLIPGLVAELEGKIAQIIEKELS